jgi:hypothetical protein
LDWKRLRVPVCCLSLLDSLEIELLGIVDFSFYDAFAPAH